MAWQFGKGEEPPRPVDRLQLVEQPTVDALLKAKQARRARIKERRADTIRDRVRQFLRTMPQGETVESIAATLETNCKLVREILNEAKAAGWIIEAAHRSHVLIRVGRVTA